MDRVSDSGDGRLAMVHVDLDGYLSVETEVNPDTELANQVELLGLGDTRDTAESQGSLTIIDNTSPTLSPAANYDRCTDPSYTLTGGHWYTESISYYSYTDSKAGDLNAGDLVDAAFDADDWYWSPCTGYDHANQPWMDNNAHGIYPADITVVNGESTCTSTSNDENTIDFGPLGAGTIGFACWRLSGLQTLEADMRLDEDAAWATSLNTCSGEYLLQSVLSHEFGHFMGLGHVSEMGGRDLTMSPNIDQCVDVTDIGLGDWEGMVAIYGMANTPQIHP